MTEQTTAAATETTEQAPGLSINDIGAMVQMIDVCSKRGAFEGAELKTVGTLRERIVAFLQSVAPPQEEGAEGEAPAEEETAA